MKIITIANRKGGTGKSTVCFNLGFTYALENRRVLFIDLDSQGNLSMLAKQEPISLEEFKDLSIRPINKMIDILPATKRFNALETEIQQLLDRNSYIRTEIIDRIGVYDYVIIDTAPSLNILNINAFCVSDLVHIVVNPDFFSLAGLVEMREILGQIRAINPKLEYKITLNAFVKNRNFSGEVIEALKKDPNYTGIEIPHRQHVIESSALRQPAIELEEIHKPFKLLAGII